MSPKSLFDPPVRKSATLSACGTYRYSLEREWNPKRPPLCFVMLNPSTANADIDDPTIRRCVGFARREGAGGLIVVNLFALRSSTPALLGVHEDPVGPENVQALGEAILWSAVSQLPLVAAWGAWKAVDRQAHEFMRRAVDFEADLRCLGTTKDGYPRHPLYVRGDQPLVEFAA